MIRPPPAPPITNFDPWAALTKMEGTMDDGGRSPGTGGRTDITCRLISKLAPYRTATSISVSIHHLTKHGWASRGGHPRGHHAAHILPSFSPLLRGGPLHLPGGGVTWEPGSRFQHRSKSSLLSRMPVRGEYIMAPKLQKGRCSLRSGCRLPSPTWDMDVHLLAFQDPLVLAAALQHAGAPILSVVPLPKIHPWPPSGCPW